MPDFDPRLLRRIQVGSGTDASDALAKLVQDGHARNPDLLAATEQRVRDAGDVFLQSVLVN
jgi:hypothetical protein